MTKLSLCVAFTIALLVGLNSVPSLVYAQTDEEAAQPSEQPQTDNTAQHDQAATPGQSAKQDAGDDTQDATDEPENQTDDQSPENQE
jgi:HD-like signal output (HDOD) protein